MPGRSAVLFLLDDTRRTGSDLPLMLHRALGVPLLKWLTEALKRADVTRFFLICAPAWTEAAEACFPEGAALTTASEDHPSDRLHVFLSTADEAEESVLVVTGPVIYAPCHSTRDTERASNACMISRRDLMQALDESIPIGHFLRRAGEPCIGEDGFFTLRSPLELPAWAPILNQDYLEVLSRSGVEIWDRNAVWVQPGIEVGRGTSLLPGTILEGRTAVGTDCVLGPDSRIIDTVVGDGCTVESSRLSGVKLADRVNVGPFANLRPGAVLADGTKAGAFVELKNTTLGEGTQVPHLSYLGDTSVGSGANIGCGTVTANFDRVDKFPTIIGNSAFVGCNTTLVAPVTLGQGAYIGAGSVVTEDIPAQALGISRSRLQTKKEWAARHKQAQETTG